MSRVYYAVRYRLDHKDRFLIWHSEGAEGESEADGVVVSEAGLIPIFRTQQSMIAYTQDNGLSPLEEDGSGYHNLDVVVKWLKRKRPAQLDCEHFLAAWNLLADISASIGGSFDPDKDKTQKIYDKLFWGNNLPALTPASCSYEPLWRGKENQIMRQVLRNGLAMFRSCVMPAEPVSAL